MLTALKILATVFAAFLFAALAHADDDAAIRARVALALAQADVPSKPAPAPAPAPKQSLPPAVPAPSYAWAGDVPGQMSLYRDGKQIGAMRLTDRVYLAFDGSAWAAGVPPYPLPQDAARVKTPEPVGHSHSHKCPFDGTVWVHDDSSFGNVDLHRCPKCGRVQWEIWQRNATRPVVRMPVSAQNCPT